MNEKSYKDLKVWCEAMEFVKMVYLTVKLFPHEELYALADQLKRAAVSIPSNTQNFAQAVALTPELRISGAVPCVSTSGPRHLSFPNPRFSKISLCPLVCSTCRGLYLPV